MYCRPAEFPSDELLVLYFFNPFQLSTNPPISLAVNITSVILFLGIYDLGRAEGFRHVNVVVGQGS